MPALVALVALTADDALCDVPVAVGLGEWPEGLGAGLDTVLAERGTSVPGGERRRAGRPPGVPPARPAQPGAPSATSYDHSSEATDTGPP